MAHDLGMRCRVLARPDEPNLADERATARGLGRGLPWALPAGRPDPGGPRVERPPTGPPAAQPADLVVRLRARRLPGLRAAGPGGGRAPGADRGPARARTRARTRRLKFSAGAD